MKHPVYKGYQEIKDHLYSGKDFPDKSVLLRFTRGGLIVLTTLQLDEYITEYVANHESEIDFNTGLVLEDCGTWYNLYLSAETFCPFGTNPEN